MALVCFSSGEHRWRARGEGPFGIGFSSLDPQSGQDAQTPQLDVAHDITSKNLFRNLAVFAKTLRGSKSDVVQPILRSIDEIPCHGKRVRPGRHAIAFVGVTILAARVQKLAETIVGRARSPIRAEVRQPPSMVPCPSDLLLQV